MRATTISGCLAVLWMAAVGCGPAVSPGEDHGGNADPTGVDAGSQPPLADAAPVADYSYVYAHTPSTLYRVDPNSLEVERIDAFGWPGAAGQITDIALDESGQMVAISFDQVFRVDKDTAELTLLADLDGRFNGMSFLPAEEVDSTGAEILVGVRGDGVVFEIDPDTGATQEIGAYGFGIDSSGDIVSVRGFGTVATVRVPGKDDDQLALIEPGTFAATVIGDGTGVSNIWGLGFWKNQVYGFTSLGLFVLIDVNTGVAQTVESGAPNWWGAGVTTEAPIVE